MYQSSPLDYKYLVGRDFIIISSLEDLAKGLAHTRHWVNLKEMTHSRAGKSLFGKRGGDLSKEGLRSPSKGAYLMA